MASEQNLTLKSFDGLDLVGKSWPVQSPKAAVLILHGMGEHVLRFDHVAAFFNMNQIAAIGFDHRGHGQSGGKRGHMPALEAIFKDIDMGLAEAAKQFPGSPIFIYGHSLGGNLALSYTLNRKPAIRGTIASAPWIQLAFSPPALKVKIGIFLAKLFPGVLQNNELDVNFLSRDTEVVEKYVADPLVHDRISLSMATGMLQQGDYLHNWKGKFPVPLLLLHGTADQITSANATEAFYQRNRQENDMQLKLYRDFYHEIHNEPQRSTEFHDILNWIEAHI
ncbi:MAG: lysophospholipase [Saprospiraceae bacterium]|nr:lysophospholipase [Saprospiraceae bacterium]